MSDVAAERYREIIDDWRAFQDAASSPLPNVIRTNTLKITPSSLRQRLAAAGVRVTSFHWIDELLDVSDDEAPGARLEHWLGLYYIQEAVQTLPVIALDAQPDERVLDLCASPGGKTTFLAACMDNRGTLVANEPNGRRQLALLANLNRLGVLNAQVTAYQGENFPCRAAFDRVLVDAPCSAEGTLRKEPALRAGASLESIARLARLQRRLIVRGFDLLADDGVLVYSTCTFAPEENEAVVAHLLRERDARLLPIPAPAGVGGVDHWQGDAYPADVRSCVRIYPHHLNSGGGFVARIARA